MLRAQSSWTVRSAAPGQLAGCFFFLLGQPERRRRRTGSSKAVQEAEGVEKARERPRVSVASGLAAAPREAAVAALAKTTSIQSMRERDFARRYRLGPNVMESAHAGMFFATMSDGAEVVVKVHRKTDSFVTVSDEMQWRYTMETQLRSTKHETICDLMEVIETSENYYVVMESIPGRDLFETASSGKLGHADVRQIVRQILEGAAVMHGAGRIHKDLKLENVMVCGSSRKGGLCGEALSALSRASTRDSRAPSWEPQSPLSAKLIDFDTVEDWKPGTPVARRVHGTDGYIAPEAYRGAYSPASDIFSVGVMMYTLLTGRFPFRKEMFDDAPGQNYVGSPDMERIRSRLMTLRINFECSPLDRCAEAASLCEAMLSVDPGSRPSAEQALSHTWFQLPFESLPEQEEPARR